MVAVVSARAQPRSILGEPRWTLAALGVLVVGLGVRIALGGTGIGERSALVMTVLLGGGAWVAARLFGGPRSALLVLAGVLVLLDIAAMPNRSSLEYDDLEAFYRSDQVFTAQLDVPSGLDVNGAAVTMLAKPMFEGATARFGLAGEVNGRSLNWTCAFQRGVVQRLALPVPPDVVRRQSRLNAQLHLSGTPARDGDYLVVYASSRLGGFVVGLAPLSALDPAATRCSTQ